VICISEAVKEFNFKGLRPKLKDKAVVLYDWCDGPPASIDRSRADSRTPPEAREFLFRRFGLPDDARVILMPSRIEIPVFPKRPDRPGTQNQLVIP
jgi:hypothetical protein